jgi:FdhD protein
MSNSIILEKIDILSSDKRRVREQVAIEEPVNIVINGEYIITLLATPQMKKELTLGWLFDEGVLETLDQIEQVIEGRDVVEVITKKPVEQYKIKAVSTSRLITTACGLSAQRYFELITGINLKPIVSKFHIRAEKVIDMVHKIDEGKLFRLTGGVHVAALFEKEKLVAFAEDVGRHNTIDKVVGKGILTNVNFSNSVLVSSGRQPADMILKTARMGIPIVVSKAAPIYSGIITAKKVGITMVCFVRNQKMNIYSNHNRILR